MLRLVTPDLVIFRVEQLEVPRLRALGLESLLLDVDCTLKNYRSEGILPEVAKWIGQLRMEGIGMCLVSNGGAARIQRFAERVELPYVAKAMKPLPFGCRTALRKMQFDPARTAMVGDQLFADVMAGRLAGLFTILVHPIRPEEEPWFTRCKRPLERILACRTQTSHEIALD